MPSIVEMTKPPCKTFKKSISLLAKRHGLPREEAMQFAKLVLQHCIGHLNYRTADWEADLLWKFHDGRGIMHVDLASVLNSHVRGIID